MASAAYANDGRAMRIGRVLSRAFAAIGSAPLIFFGTSLVLGAAPLELFNVMVREAMPLSGVAPRQMIARALPMMFGVLVIWWLLYMMAQAVLFCATVAESDARPGRLGDYVAAAVRALPPLVGLSILLTIAVWIGSILLIVPGVMLALMWSVAAPALVVERTGVFASFGRSRYLTSGARWRIFGLVLLVFIIYLGASMIVGIGSVAANGVAAAAAASRSPSAVGTIVSLVLQTAFLAIWSAIQGALYVELRDWKDGPAGERLAGIFA